MTVSTSEKSVLPNFFTRFIPLTAGLFIALSIGEILVRLTGAAPEVVYIEKWRMRLSANPKIGYEPIPHLDATGQSFQYYGYQGVSNSLGFRDREHPVEKVSDSKRIIVLGDSIAAGLWVKNDEDVFPAVLEKELLKKGLPAEVMNFGVLGYNTQQEVETLKEKGLRYKPDLVVLAYCLNDRSRDDGNIYGLLLHEAKTGNKIDRSKTPPWAVRSALVRFIWYRVFPSFTVRHTHSESSDAGTLAKDTVGEYFGLLAELSRKNRFKVVVAVFPEFKSIEKRESAYPFLDMHESIKKLCVERGFFCLDLLPVFRACKKAHPSELVAFDRFHPRPVGHHCAGEALAEFISDKLASA